MVMVIKEGGAVCTLLQCFIVCTTVVTALYRLKSEPGNALSSDFPEEGFEESTEVAVRPPPTVKY